MNIFSRNLPGLLLATSALVAPTAAVAQTAEAPAAEPEASSGVEITIVGRFIPEPLRNTSEVVSVLTAEDLERQGDDNAATALARVAGLNIQDGRFVYVRGLGERYSSALLNGSPLPSPEPLQRVVPLDLFPSNILAGTEVQKTFSPQYPGEFGGGQINLKTMSVPSETFLQVSASVSGDSQTTNKEGLTYYGSQSDRWGFDDGTRKVPPQLQEAFKKNRRIVLGSDFTASELQRIGWDFVNAPLNLLQDDDTISPNYGFDLSAGTSVQAGGVDYGIIAVGGFDNSWETRNGEKQSGIINSSGNLVRENDFDFTSTQNDVTINGLIGLGAEWGRNEVTWTNLYVRNTTKEARRVIGFSSGASADVLDDFTEWFEREMFMTQIAGSHDIGNLTVEWRGSSAHSSREAPYQKSIRYVLDVADGVYEYDGSSQVRNSTEFSDIFERVNGAGVDVTYVLPLTNAREVSLSAGTSVLSTERKSERRSFEFELRGALNESEQRERVDFLFSNFNIRPDRFELRETSGADGAAAYDASLDVLGYYVAADAEVIPRLRAALGVRFEDGEQSVKPRNVFFEASPAPLASTKIEESYVLPAATLTWNFAEDMQLRLGASKTIARPQFRELAFQTYLDVESDRLFIGNPFLVDSELLNLDSRFEYFFERGEYVTVGAFYKDIDKPVEAVLQSVGSGQQQSFLNAPRAVLYGIEFDARTVLDVPERFSLIGAGTRLFLAANYTYSKSELRVEPGDKVTPSGSTAQPTAALNLVTDGDQLQGQSEHLANLQFGIENDDTETQATFLVNYGSERISLRGTVGVPDYVIDPGTTLDFVLRQGFTVAGRPLTFGFEMRNLTGQDFEEYQSAGSGKVFINTYDVGTSISLSLSSRF